MAAAVACVALSSGAVRADSLTDVLGPRELAVGEARRAESIGALATRLNPAGLSLNRRLVFEGSYGYRSSDGAHVVAATACDSTVPVPGCFYYNYLTADPEIGGADFKRRVHEFGVAASRSLTPQLSLGTNLRWFDYNSNLAGEEDASGVALDVGVNFKASSSVSVAAVGYNLYAAESQQYPRGAGGGVVVRPGGGALSIAFDGVWDLETEEDEQTGRYGGGIEYFLTAEGGQAGYPLRLGMVYDNSLDGTFLSGGVGFASQKVGLDVGARRQVGGEGDELMFIAALRVFGPTQ